MLVSLRFYFPSFPILLLTILFPRIRSDHLILIFPFLIALPSFEARARRGALTYEIFAISTVVLGRRCAWLWRYRFRDVVAKIWVCGLVLAKPS